MTTITVNNVRSRLRSRRRIRGIAVGLLFLVVTGLTLGWVYKLAYRPKLTPMFTVAVTEYAWPVDPNAWASEDVLRMRALDRQTVRVSDLSPDWRSRELALKRLESDLTALAASGGLAETVVFYFSLHGLVDSQGKPHLLPTDASPLDSATWLPVSEVLDLIADKLPPAVNKLVLIDGNRSASNWRMGLLHNTFADRLVSAVDPRRHPNLVIVNSVSPDEIGWSSPALAGSLFGYFTARGLSGYGDDGSGRVTLGGLVDYVNREMANWCRAHRMPMQRAMQVPASVDDFAVTWPLSPRVFDRLQQALPLASESSVVADQRDALWRQAGELPRQVMLSAAPEALSDLEHQLLWLEKLAVAGKAYERQAKLHLANVRRRLELITDVISAGDSRLSPVAIRGALVSRPVASLRGERPPSLQLAATLGCLPAEVVDEAQQRWQALVGGVTSDRLKETLRRFDEIAVEGISTKAPSDSVRESVFDDAHLLRLFERYEVVNSWSRRDPIAAALRMRGESDRLSAMRLDGGRQEIRSVPWVAPAIFRADAQRLVLEDYLVAGQAVGGDAIDGRVSAAESAYQDATKRLGEVSRGIEICDDALHRLPYLAEALSVLMPESDPTPERPVNIDWVATLVLPAMRDAVSLSRQLDEVVSWRNGQGVDDGVPFAATAERLRAAVEQSDRLLDDWVRSNIAEPELSGRSLLALRSALDLPWLSWQDRSELRKTHDQIASSLGFIEQAGDDDGGRDGIAWGPRGGEAPTVRRLTTLDHILAWPVHPAVLATGVEVATSVDGDGVAGGPAVVPAESGIARVEQMGYLVREALSHWTGDAKSSPWDDPSTSIKDWMGAARWQRRSLALATGTPSNSPMETVWRDRLQWLLLWHADRQLDAFYGTPTPAAAVRTERPFFDSAVDRCLQLVDAIGPVASGVQQDLVAIKKRQVNRRLASRVGMVVNVSSSPLPAGGDISVNLTVSPGELGQEDTGRGDMVRGDLGRGAAESFPVGHPSVWVKTDTGELATGVVMFATPLAGPKSFQLDQSGGGSVGVSADLAAADAEVGLNPPAESVAAEAVAGEASAAVASAGGPESLPVPVAPRPGLSRSRSLASSAAGSPRLTAFAVFRGNEFSRSFVANRLGGRIVEYQPHRFGESSITLLGQRRKRASILFVLDCSRSMEEPLAGESSALGGASRMETAKAALVEMLDELSRQEGTRIGVVLLGHRVAWTKSDPPRISLSPGAGVDVPIGLMPSRDVETILPLGRFDSGRVLQRLDQVRPWGQTPLYLAVIEALQAFSGDDPDTEKQVIVITDGRDYQFTPPRSDIRQPAKTTMSDVIRTAAEVDVPVFIVGFGLQPEERTAAENDFQQIADATGGETVSVDNAGDLLRRIRDRLAPGTFTVTDRPSAGDPAAAGSRSITATLNGTVKVDPRMVDGDTFELVFESASASIPLEGGEALQIGLSADGSEFLPLPFDWQFPTPHDLVVGPSGRQSGYRLNAHRPLRQGDSVVFPVSVRSDRDAVTRRPAESWLTVTPVIGGVEMPNERYWFYDVNFEPGQPVPLLKWEARGWPSEAGVARLDYWCKFDPTPATEELPLREVLENPDAFVGRKLSDFPSIKLQVGVSDRKAMGDLYVVNVIQRHEGQSPDLGQLRAEFRTAADYRPIRVTHQFDPNNGIVSSTFAFRAADAAGIERSDRSAIALISRSASQADALRLSGGQAVEVEVMRNDDLLLGQPLGVTGQ